jgi:hypothetical protein
MKRASTGTDRLLPSAAHLNLVIRILVALFLSVAPAAAAVPPGCVGSASLGTFQLLVRPFSKGSPLPLKAVAAIPGGARLIWDPVHLTPRISSGAEIAAVLVPAAEDGDLITLEPRKAATRTEWQLPARPQVIALIFGPQGLSEGKITSLVTHNRDLLKQLADYAEESSKVESLVQELANAEQSGGGADAVLKGFSTRYGGDLTRLDPKASSDQQAALLLKTVLPTSTSYDPLAARSAQVQQSGGLAASVAGLFFGNPVALAAGGAALFTSLKSVMFPSTEFRSAFAQTANKDGLSLCTKDAAPKSKTRTAYLWAYRVPQLKKPALSLAGTPHLPVGSKSTVALQVGGGPPLRELERARDWLLTPAAGGGASIPVEVRPAGTAALEIDPAKAPAGDYQLSTTWDWEPLPVAGTLHLHPYDDFTHVTIAPEERDKLVEGSGKVKLKLSGADFEFLEKAALESSEGKPAEVAFTLPSGKRAGPQNSVTVSIDTAKQGSYRLLLTQSDGAAHPIPVTVLPPNPKLSNLPIRLNMGEARQPLRLQGSGLERIEGASSDAGEITGAPAARGWSGEITLKSDVQKGSRFPLLLKVKDLSSPVTVPDALEIVGPRPQVQSVRKSLAGAPGVEIGADELPAGTPAGLVLTVDHLNEGTRPRVELSCEGGGARQSLALSAGEPSGGASLTFAGPGALYLSVDPGVVGYAGCRLTATVALEPEGRSDPFVLGRVIRVPRLDKFILTTEKAGDSGYAGNIEGRDLDVIERTGWDAQHGLPVESIPTPIAGDPARQSLRVVLPWPAPAPHAPLYVWLRGETSGRKTGVAY